LLPGWELNMRCYLKEIWLTLPESRPSFQWLVFLHRICEVPVCWPLRSPVLTDNLVVSFSLVIKLFWLCQYEDNRNVLEWVKVSVILKQSKEEMPNKNK
jgi:hypothetical protein